MNLIDGLEYFKTYSDSEWEFTIATEKAAVEVLRLMSVQRDHPDSVGLNAVHRLLMDIEKWKAMCLRERMGNAEQNSPMAVWNAFRGAILASTDLDCILSIMQLKGFGSSRDEDSGQRRAKVATAALRFVKPDSWGVVDWRTAAMLGLLVESKGDVDKALALATRHKPTELRQTYDLIDEHGACAYNQLYRERRTAALPRAVDVEMSIFGLSIRAWPFPQSAFK